MYIATRVCIVSTLHVGIGQPSNKTLKIRAREVIRLQPALATPFKPFSSSSQGVASWLHERLATAKFASGSGIRDQEYALVIGG